MRRAMTAACALVLVAAAMGLWPSGAEAGGDRGGRASRPTRFAVISDPHYYDAALGTEGAAFEVYLAQDRKMIRESHAILQAAIDGIIEKGVDFVIVPGDLTKDGELRNHLGFAKQMRRLERHGIEVYVVPGNHDIENPEAFAYRDGGTRRVANVSPAVFRAIYHEFGYGEAIAHDRASLSYLVEPAQGLWVIAIDSCRYQNNASLDHSETGGAISDATMRWVLRILREANARDKRVIAFMHHGVLEHFSGQSSLFPDYVLDDWQDRAAALAQAGLKMVFTGHFHAQDITKAAFPTADGGTATIHDIETGSLVTYSSPYRTVTVARDGSVQIATEHVTAIDYDTAGMLFPEYALDYLQQGLLGIVTAQLTQGYGVPEADAAWLAPLIMDGFVAHYAGDERAEQGTMQLIGRLIGDPDPTVRMLGGYLGTLWTDLAPNDLALSLHPWPAAAWGGLPFWWWFSF